MNTSCKSLFTLFLISISFKGFSQKTNGSVQSLVNTEKYFNELAAKKGINSAFIEMAEEKGVVFRPNPVNTIEYYNKQEEAKFQLQWKPEFAMISKSGYFGFTTGPYELKSDDESHYGHYLSIWKAETNKKWKLVLDAGISHAQPEQVLDEKFYDPSNYKYPKLIGPAKIKMRKDMVFSTDELFGKALKNTGNKNFNEYYDENVRLYFPNEQPLIGKQNAIAFIDKKNKAITSYPNFSDRAISGDLAYTNGKAEIANKKYNYIRVWKIDEEMKWNILIDMYVEE